MRVRDNGLPDWANDYPAINGLIVRCLLDLQPSLSVVLTESQGANVTRYVHVPRGIHAQKDSAGNWEWMVNDGLGSVREVVDNNLNVEWTGSPDPYGVYFNEVGTRQSIFMFTGEMLDDIGLQYHRKRYYSPALGVFPSLDPFEGMWDVPMTINRCGYVSGNTINYVDLSGLCWANPNVPTEQQNICYDAWLQYTNSIAQTFTRNWPRDVRILVSQEARYWGNLTYADFVNQWNSSRPPASNNTGENTLSSGLSLAAVISQLDSPFPGPADFLAVGVAICTVGLAALANTGAISLPPRPAYDFDRVVAAAGAATITIATFTSMINEAAPSKGGRKFDLAFSKEPELFAFALSFGFEPITLPFFYWPKWMTNNDEISLSKNFFRASFDPVLSLYFGEIPGGKLKLNLSGLDSSHPMDITTWEVWKLSTQYASKTEYYTFENLIRRELSSTEAAPLIAQILSTFPSSLWG